MSILTSYTIVLAIIVLLAVINFATLYWVLVLQQQLQKAHSRPTHPTPPPPPPPDHISPEDIKELEAAATAELEKDIATTTQQFEGDLSGTLKKVNTKVEDLTDKVIADELTKYQNAIGEVRQASIESLSRIQANIEKESQKNAEDVTLAVETEKKKVIATFEAKMGDIVAGYLVEVLGTNVDLGAQRAYLFATLEAHKQELKQAISDGA